MNYWTLILLLATYCTAILSYPYEDTYRQGDIVGNHPIVNRNLPNRNVGGYPNSGYRGGYYGNGNNLNRGYGPPRLGPGSHGYGQQNRLIPGIPRQNQVYGQRRKYNGYLKPRFGLGGYRNDYDDYQGSRHNRRPNIRNRRPNLFYNDYNNEDYIDDGAV